MRTSTSFALTIALSSMLALSTAVAGEPAPPPGAATNELLSSGTAVGSPQVTVGFYWCKLQQSYRYLGDNKTWGYFEACQPSSGSPNGQWWWCNDNECEQTFIAAAASAHFIGVNFNSTSTFSYVRLYKY